MDIKNGVDTEEPDIDLLGDDNVDLGPIILPGVKYLKTYARKFQANDEEKEFKQLKEYLLEKGWPAFTATTQINDTLNRNQDMKDGDQVRVNGQLTRFFCYNVWPSPERGRNQIIASPSLIVSATTTFGDVLLETAWHNNRFPPLSKPSGGLTLWNAPWPRQRLSPKIAKAEGTNSTTVVIEFHYVDPKFESFIKAPVSISSLDKTILSNTISFDTRQSNGGRGQTIGSILESLKVSFPGLNLYVYPTEKRRLVKLHKTTNILTDVLDEIYHLTGTSWEWIDQNSILLLPKEQSKFYPQIEETTMLDFAVQEPKKNTATFASTGSLRHLDRFNYELDEQEYWHTTDYFLSGGWPEIIRQYFYESPDRGDGNSYSPMIIFPGSELAGQRIESFPQLYSKGLLLGDMILQTAWIRGLSPRLYFLYPNGKDGEQVTAVRFVKRSQNMPMPIDKAPGITALDQLLLPHDAIALIIDTAPIDRPRGQPLQEFIDEYLPQFGTGIHVRIKPELQKQLLRMNFSTKSLAEILDSVSYCLDATWDWISSDTIYIAPGPSYGTSVTSCIGASC